MKRIKTFYHYTKFTKEIKKDKLLLATSFAKTYQLDWILENCSEELLNGEEIKKLLSYMNQNKQIIETYKKEQANDENYESCYRDLKLKYKNKSLNKFFNNEGYVLAFSKKFQKGWLKGENEDNYVASIFAKIGNKFIKFKINDKIAQTSYVLEQKYWTEKYHIPILKKKFGKEWKKLSETFSKEIFGGQKPKLRKYTEFKKFFIRLLFVNYYKSIVRLNDYKGNFEVPEFWIGSDIPTKICEFGEVPFKELEKKTGATKKQILERKITKADLCERKKKSSRSPIANKK
jgi:hypothetical protein